MKTNLSRRTETINLRVILAAAELQFRLKTLWRFSLAGIVFAVVALSSNAQTWNGQGTNDNWSNGQNWVGGVPPVSSSSTYVNIAGSTRLTPIVDTDYTLNRLDFDPNAGSGGPPNAFVI